MIWFVFVWYGMGIVYLHWTTLGLANWLFNPTRVVYMRRWTGSALVQIMTCRLFGAQPLPEAMVTHCQQSSVKFESKYKTFHSIKCIWKCRRPAKWRPFFSRRCVKRSITKKTEKFSILDQQFPGRRVRKALSWDIFNAYISASSDEHGGYEGPGVEAYSSINLFVSGRYRVKLGAISIESGTAAHSAMIYDEVITRKFAINTNPAIATAKSHQIKLPWKSWRSDAQWSMCGAERIKTKMNKSKK